MTIVIPCYNQAHFLGEALESIIKQTYQNFEIIVVNDGSTDNTSEVALSFPKTKVIEQKNVGLATSRNNGLRQAKGEFIVFLDADDRLLLDALEIGVQELKNHPECAFVSGFCDRISYEGDYLPTTQLEVDNSDNYLSLLKINYIWSPSNVMYRREIFKKTAGFNAEISPVADYEIYLRIARHFPTYHHSEIITEYRQHQMSMSKNFALMLENVLSVLKMQKEFVKGNKPYQKALKQSTISYKCYYLDCIFAQSISSIKGGNWMKGFKQGLFLLSYPMVLPKLFNKLLRDKIDRIKNA